MISIRILPRSEGEVSGPIGIYILDQHIHIRRCVNAVISETMRARELRFEN